MSEMDGGTGGPDGGEPEDPAKPAIVVMQTGTPGAPAFEALSGPVDDRMRKYNSSSLPFFEAAERIGFLPFKGWESIQAADQVKGESQRWTSTFLQEHADPYHPGTRVKHWIHRHMSQTVDLLRHDVVFHTESTADRPEEEVTLRIFESIELLYIVVLPPKGREILKLPIEQRAAEAGYYADRILRRVGTFDRYMGGAGKVHYTWTFRHGPLEEGAWFSTDATQSIFWQGFWPMRVDGGIRKGHLFFWCWKKPEMTSGKAHWHLGGDHWFDGESYRQLNAPHQYPPGWK